MVFVISLPSIFRIPPCYSFGVYVSGDGAFVYVVYVYVFECVVCVLACLFYEF